MSEIILHIGLHKTATGTLQRQLFPACKELQLITTLKPEMKYFMEEVTRRDPLYFNAGKTRDLLGAVLSKEKLNLISNESLSGPPYAGLIEAGLDHRSPVLSNLQAVFPSAKVILVLRRQDTLAQSLYRQYLKVGGTRSMTRFYGMESIPRAPLMNLDRFKYLRYVDAVNSAFPNGVLLLPFEEFIEEQATFLGKISDFIGIKLPDIKLRTENATKLGPFGMEMSRILNHLFRNLANPGGILPGIPTVRFGKIKLISPLELFHDKFPGKKTQSLNSNTYRLAQDILEIVRSDNQSLDSKYKLDLDRHGYY